MSKYIMTLDSGTTSCRTIILDKKGNTVSMAQQEFTQFFPQSGWVEHDAYEIWNTQRTTIVNAKHKAKIKSTDIEALGVTNQRETIVVWDKETGYPVYNAIVWQDGRTAKYCNELIKQGYNDMFKQKTGLVINPYFSGTKLKWILENVESAKDKLKKGSLLAGTIDTWLIWKLTNGKVHATDVSNASRTLLFNINTQEWDDEILKLLNIPKEILPEVRPSSGDYGIVEPIIFSRNAKGKVPITGVIGDQQGALFGQLCTEVGDIKNTYGTGCFTLVNTGTKPILSKNGLLTTIAWKINEEETVYAIEGSVFIAGASIQWLRDAMKIIYDASHSDLYVDMVKDNQRIYMVPSFTGLGAPYWDSSAKGAIYGLTRGTKREHIIKATLESIAYQANDLFNAMSQDLKRPLNKVSVDGGVSRSDYLMQFQASISDIHLEKPENIESTALGASFLAGLHVGFWTKEELKTIRKVDKNYNSIIKPQERELLLKGWSAAIKRTKGWENDIK
ncbi:MAG: glycerol kinase GlpK [Mycoplasma sp.]|nr:glycerol kinase GlpK [Mycoplasma sp.]